MGKPWRFFLAQNLADRGNHALTCHRKKHDRDHFAVGLYLCVRCHGSTVWVKRLPPKCRSVGGLYSVHWLWFVAVRFEAPAFAWSRWFRHLPPAAHFSAAFLHTIGCIRQSHLPEGTVTSRPLSGPSGGGQTPPFWVHPILWPFRH